MNTDTDIKYMKEALRLAKKGLGYTSPNPVVGAVVVKNDTVITRGYHMKAGAPHAEAIALKQAGKRAKGATLYTNLEPCCHYGSTPPCVEGIIEAGIRRVVIGMEDPNPIVKTRGIEILRKAGIEVTVGVLEDKCRRLNEIFVKYITTGIPFVILKAAISLDGKIATRTGDSRWISSKESRRVVHKLRHLVDATIVGIGTVIRDNPQLTIRMGIKNPLNPKRIIVDSLLKIPLKYYLVTQSAEVETYIATTALAPPERVQVLEEMGVKLIYANTKGQNKVELADLIKRLGQMNITSIMIEGGAEVNASAIEEGIVDKVLFFIAPKIIGGKSAPTAIGGRGIQRIADAVNISITKHRFINGDIIVEGYIENNVYRNN